MVQKVGEPLLLPLPCGLSYAGQSLCHAGPALRPERVWLVRIPRGPRPSLHHLLHRHAGFVRRLRRYYDGVRLLTSVHHWLRLFTFPTRAARRSPTPRSDVRPPRFQRDPFERDGFFDHGRATAPRLAGPLMLPSTFPTVSASATGISRLIGPPHSIAVYASRPPSPTELAQHSLPGRTLLPCLCRTSTGWIAPALLAHRELRKCGNAPVGPGAGAIPALPRRDNP